MPEVVQAFGGKADLDSEATKCVGQCIRVKRPALLISENELAMRSTLQGSLLLARKL
jgi:hypothetical protein